MSIKDLKKRVTKAPESPGIYKWMDKNGNVIYIGKAKNLKNRLKSYIQEPDPKGVPLGDKTSGPWKMMLYKQIADFDVTVTNTELEALVLETNLIKENKPKYNVLMKDGKSYLYVQISKDPYPVVEVVRKGVEPNTIGFGPFTGKMDIRKTLDMLHAIYPFKACRKSLDSLNRSTAPDGEPCLEEQIGECCGLCKGKLTQEEYSERINFVIDFLKGNRKPTINKLNEEMQSAATNKKFERAAKLRDALKAIERMEEKQLVSDPSDEDMDVIGVAVINSKAQIVLFKQRSGKVIDELSLTLAGQAESEAESLAQFIPQYYSQTPDVPPLIAIGAEIHESPLQEWLCDQSGHAVELRTPQRGKKSKLLELAEKNAHEKLKAMETKWEAAAKNTEAALNELKTKLNLSDIPKRIECYDISHTSGTETVGSMVVAKNGKAANDQYRHFTIRTLKEGEVDDYKALAEVLKRRLRYLSANLKEEEAKWKKKGITFGKARKPEQKVLEEIHEQNKEHLSFKNIDYKEYVVARKDKKIIGFVRMSMRDDDKVLHMKSLWVNEKFRHYKLGQTITRFLLKQAKKEKVYIITSPSLEEYYADVGFRHVIKPPKGLGELDKRLSKETKQLTGLIMVYIPSEHKEDKSLNSKPDLIVIDGGKGQVSTVVKVLKEMNLEIPVIGLAKKEEEVFLPNESDPVHFSKDSQAVFLLMRLRNEAHRFANRLREKKVEKAMIG